MVLSQCRDPEKDPVTPVEPPTAIDTLPVPLIWEAYVWKDTLNPYYSHSLVINQGVLVYRIGQSGEVYEPMRARDMADGQLLWDWADFSHDYPTGRIYAYTSFGDQFVFNNLARDIYLVDPHTGINTARIFQGNEYFHSTRFGLGFDDYLYYSSHREDTVFYYRINEAADLDTLWYQLDGDYYQRYPFNCTSWKHPNGDTLLVIVDLVEPTPQPINNQTDVVVYNITADSLQYRTKIVDTQGITPQTERTMIVGDRLFMTGRNAIHGFDLVKGEQIWTASYPDAQGFIYPSLIHEGVIITNDVNGMYATDLDGNNLWINKSAFGGKAMDAYKGVVYTCTVHAGMVKAVDVHTGELLWKLPPPRDAWNKDASFFQTGIGIDQSTGRLVLSDKYSIMCFQLPQ